MNNARKTGKIKTKCYFIPICFYFLRRRCSSKMCSIWESKETKEKGKEVNEKRKTNVFLEAAVYYRTYQLCV